MKNRTVLLRDSSTPLRFAQNDFVILLFLCFLPPLEDSEEAEEEDYRISMQSP